jgi:hypothetical protein
MNSMARAVLALSSVMLGQAALADTQFPITSTVINVGTTLSENYQVDSTGNAVTGVTPTVTYDLGNTFNETGSTTGNASNLATASDFGATASGPGGPWNFQDNYYFSTSGSGATVYASAIASMTDVSNLQVRIIAASGTTATNGAQLVSGPGVVTIEDSWQTFTGGPTDFTALLPVYLAPNSYILQIRGEASTPGSYGGTVTFDPVPLPPALPLLLAGLAALGLLAGSRRAPQPVFVARAV